MVTARYPGNVPTEFNNIIHSYNSITGAIIESHYEILWANKSGAGLGCISTAYYGAAPDDVEKQVLISQQSLRSKILGLWIKNSLTAEGKRKLIVFRTSYTFKHQDYGAAMFFVVVKIVCPDTIYGCSDIKTKLDTMKISQFKHSISKANLQILEWMN